MSLIVVTITPDLTVTDTLVAMTDSAYAIGATHVYQHPAG